MSRSPGTNDYINAVYIDVSGLGCYLHVMLRTEEIMWSTDDVMLLHYCGSVEIWPM